MKFRFRRILVAIKDPDHPSQAQLRKAASLARAHKATLELFHAIDDPEIRQNVHRSEVIEAPGDAMAAIAAHAARRLERLSHAAALSGVRVETTPSWDYPPHEALIRRAEKTHADLIIAAAQPHKIAGRLLLANTDWELMRYSPVPVLIVRSPGDYEKPSIVAAIDPFHAHAKPSGLDSRILAVGHALCHALKGELHVFHAYMPLNPVMPGVGGMVMELPPEFEDLHGARIEKVFDRVSTRAHVPSSRRHLRMGTVKGELAAVVRRVNAGIVVMGAVSRSALRRAFIGNTAEAVLDSSGCDVLVVKPAGFKSSVRRRPVRLASVLIAPSAWASGLK